MAIKIGVIPAAGMGLRTTYLGRIVPKCLLPIYDKPILQHIIDGMVKVGIDDIRIVANYRMDMLVEYIEQIEKNIPAEITVIRQPTLNGDGGAVQLASRDITEPFYVVLGDDVSYPNPFFSMCTIMRLHKAAVVEAIVEDPSWENIKRACLAEILNERIVRLIEKPTKKPRSKTMLRGCGVYLFQPEVFQELPRLKEGETYWISKLVNQWAAKSQAFHCILEYNININTPEDLLQATLFMKEKHD